MRIYLAIFLLALVGACAPAPAHFDGARAFAHVTAQMNLGARLPGSTAARATGDYVLAQLRAANARTETQEFVFRGVPLRNLVGRIAEGRGAVIILGAHYDTRVRADQDVTNPTAPVPGANDGASGVAVLLELARTLNRSKLRNEVWFVFFDAEDNGDLDSCALLQQSPCDSTRWEWSVGATHFAENLRIAPTAVVIVDMIGDAEQNIYLEGNSNAELQAQLWAIAARLGYAAQFIAAPKWTMEDDHMPFVRRGLRAVDIIDFDYPYWHTTQDTADKVSAVSLERVGRVLQVWLEQ